MTRQQQAINGDPAALATERAMEELRRGRAIRLLGTDRCTLAAAVETLEAPIFERLRSLEPDSMTLFVTPERCLALDIEPTFPGPVAIPLEAATGLDALRALAGVLRDAPVDRSPLRVEPARARSRIEAGFRLAKAARLLPALLMVQSDEPADDGILGIREADIAGPPDDELTLVSRARVPLVSAVDSEIVLFRQRYGLGEHLAILIGAPTAVDVAPVRLHSACLTGDVLGSLRCDCGDQLERAVSRMASLGGGVLLYLDQEGRGIGLANKLRAYALQDSGLDTVDADQHLGFLSDERSYGAAAAMLRELGIERIRLLTNNPGKIDALTAHGIEVVGRLPLISPVNAHNRRYLETKLVRAGHLAE